MRHELFRNLATGGVLCGDTMRGDLSFGEGFFGVNSGIIIWGWLVQHAAHLLYHLYFSCSGCVDRTLHKYYTLVDSLRDFSLFHECRRLESQHWCI